MRSFSVGQSNSSNLRVLIERLGSAQLRLNDDDDRFFARNLSYHKLPQQLLKLSVLKLDGSSFDVNVARNTTVGEVKHAIEEVFITSPKEGQGKVSWSHVWGHFCLSYGSHKLLNDKAFIRIFGIKDGDQLKFIRHLSINYSPSQRQSKIQSVACRHYSMLSSGSNAHEEKEQTGPDDINDNENQEDNCNRYEDEEQVPMPEFKLANFLRGWLSNSILWGVSRKGSEGRSTPSRFSPDCIGGGGRRTNLKSDKGNKHRNIIELASN